MSNVEIKERARKYVSNQLRDGGVKFALSQELGIDLEAYQESSICRIKILANAVDRFGVQRRWEGISGLLIVYVWNISSCGDDVFAMTYPEAVALLSERHHTKTRSWNNLGGYTLRAGEWWRNKLPEYRMQPGSWRQRIADAFLAGKQIGTK